jgi:hypothetical protein
MAKQGTFETGGFERYRKTTRREKAAARFHEHVVAVF